MRNRLSNCQALLSMSKNTTHRCRASHEGNTPLSSLLAERTNSAALLAWCPLIIWQIKHLGFVHTAKLALFILLYICCCTWELPLYISLNCLSCLYLALGFKLKLWAKPYRHTPSQLIYRTCMHWKSRVMMLLRVTSCSTWVPSPSARPLSRSRATIMKSLSGASYWSGCWLYIYNKNGTKRSREWTKDNMQWCTFSNKRTMMTYHGLSEVLLDQGDTALVNWFTIRQEATLQCCGHWRQTLQEKVTFLRHFCLWSMNITQSKRAELLYLQQGEQILVFIF